MLGLVIYCYLRPPLVAAPPPRELPPLRFIVPFDRELPPPRLVEKEPLFPLPRLVENELLLLLVLRLFTVPELEFPRPPRCVVDVFMLELLGRLTSLSVFLLVLAGREAFPLVFLLLDDGRVALPLEFPPRS